MHRHLHLSGAPFERGKQHGEQAAPLIHKAVAYCNQHSPGFSAGSEREVRQVARAIEDMLRRRCPEVVREMEGIAVGSGLSYEDILLLSVRYELDLNAFPACTCIGLPGTTDGPLIGKTDDVSLPEHELEVFFQAEPDVGHRCAYYAIVGTVWAFGGINDAGLVMAHTGLPPVRSKNRDGIPAEIFLRLLLERCATTEEALSFITAQPLMHWGHTIMLADASSAKVTAAEVYPTAIEVETSIERPLVRTNHPLLKNTAALATEMSDIDPKLRRLLANSRDRYENASRLAPEMPRSVEGMQRLLGNHALRGSICQHGQDEMHTGVAMILIPQKRMLFASEGYGCEPYSPWGW